MFTKKKPFPGDDPNQKVNFAPLGSKTSKKPQAFAKADVENAADAKQPGDAKEDAQDVKKKPKTKGASFWASKAAQTLATK